MRNPLEYREYLSVPMQKTLTRAGYDTPTPIQDQTLPLLLAGRDLIGIAQTGTGKTAAFAVPIIEKMPQDAPGVQTLVLCPTRELALQTTEVFRKLSAHKKMRVVTIYGGRSVRVQIESLAKGAQVVVGTPGRVRDLIGRKALDLSTVRTAVLDEADEMLDFGFLPDITAILKHVTGRHQTLLFSATMYDQVARVAERFLKNPEMVEIGRRNEPVKTVRQTMLPTNETSKAAVVQYILNRDKPALTLIFCNTRSRVRSLQRTLSRLGVKADALHGDLTQSQRDQIMRAFRSGKTAVLVATDVAARGIDVDGIDLVMNYDVPDKPEYYVHRIGRSGRAGNSGRAITLVDTAERPRLIEIERQFNIRIEPEFSV